MARLTQKDRDDMPKADFAGPKRTFPVEDKTHAALAKSAVSRKENDGTMTKAQGDKIDRKADYVLGDGGKDSSVSSKSHPHADEILNPKRGMGRC